MPDARTSRSYLGKMQSSYCLQADQEHMCPYVPRQWIRWAGTLLG